MHEETGRPDGIPSERGGTSEAVSPKEPLVTVPFVPDFHFKDQFTCLKSGRVQEFVRSDPQRLVSCNYTKVFVLPNLSDPRRILGFYALSACTVARDHTTTQQQKRIPRGLPVPMVLIGYMGRDDNAPRGLGPALIVDAARRVDRISELGIWGIALHAENEELATKVYLKAGFKRAKQLPGVSGSHLLMFAPLASLLP